MSQGCQESFSFLEMASFFLPRFEILRLQFFLVRENAQNDFQRFFLGSFKPFGQLFFDVFSPTGFKGALRLDTEDVWTFEGRALSLEWGGLVALHFSHYSNRIQTRLPPPPASPRHTCWRSCVHTHAMLCRWVRERRHRWMSDGGTRDIRLGVCFPLKKPTTVPPPSPAPEASSSRTDGSAGQRAPPPGQAAVPCALLTRNPNLAPRTRKLCPGRRPGSSACPPGFSGVW